MARQLRDAISTTSALAALIVVVAGTGTAVAATGGTFILGKANSARTTTTLTNSKGIALTLKSPSGSPALAVNTTKKVARLNSDLLDNLDSTKLQRRVTGVCTGVLGIQSIRSTGGVVCSKAHTALFTTPNTTSDYVVPAGVHKLFVRAQGGGSGGGGGTAVSDGGGGGGGALLEVVVDVTPGETLGVHVGEGGAGGPVGNNGTAGGGSGLIRGIDFVFGVGNGNAGFAGGSGSCAPGGGGVGGTAQPVTSGGVVTIGGGDGGDGSDGSCNTGGLGGHRGFAGGGGNGGGLNLPGEAGIGGYVLIEAIG
jgi:hypothetical protein